MAVSRRSFLQTLGATLASSFAVGRLDAGLIDDPASHELRLAAAATFEFVLQEILLPYSAEDGYPEISEEQHANCLRISRILKPHNGPGVFEEAQLEVTGQRIEVVFSAETRVIVESQQVDHLKPVLVDSEHPRDVSISDVAEYLDGVLSLLRDPDYYIDD